MDPFSESNELFTVKQLFYCAKYDELLKLKILQDEILFNEAINKYKALQYQIRSSINLKDLKKTESLIKESIKSLNTEKEALIQDDKISKILELEFKFLESYSKFILKNDSKSIELLISNYDESKENDLIDLIISNYYSLSGDDLKAIEILSNTNSLENASFLIYINIKNLNFKESTKIINNFSKISQDNLIFNLSQSWFDIINIEKSKNGKIIENLNKLQSSYYFYDELTSNESTVSIKNLICLLVCNLKLLQLPESENLIKRIEEEIEIEELNKNKDYLINKINFNCQSQNTIENKNLIENLKIIDPNSNYLSDLNEKNKLFDEIVIKYQS
ncbi:hypothetical protein B5S32_g2696 [[Candida] boidinii]|nr:hypothetical protein B5S32_g2696 [[Candida] boidinii]